MSKHLVEVHARNIANLQALAQLPANGTILENVKLPAGNFPSGFRGSEAITIGQLSQLLTVLIMADSIKVVEDKANTLYANLEAEIESVRNELIATGYVRTFASEVEIRQWVPDFDGARAESELTNKIYRWDSTAQTWVETSGGILALAQQYTDQVINDLINTKDPEPAVLVLNGEGLYNKAKSEPEKLFTAIWQEYNKPVYHLGNGTFVDVTGVSVVPHVVIPELIFTIKTLVDNETFTFPTVNVTTSPINMNIDWGDGTSGTYTNYVVEKTYTAPAGSEFQIKVRGSAIPFFDFSSNNGGRRRSRLSVKSIDKNTLPARSMARFNLSGCDNIQYICNEAFQSFSGTTFIFILSSFENVTFHKDAFKGLQHVTSIDNLFGGVSSKGKYTLPAGLFDYFINVTTAKALFQKLDSNLPDGLLDKMVNLQVVADMFKESKNVYVPQRIFKNQKKLVDVSSCFRLSQLTLDAYQLYIDMNQGSPTTVQTVFYTANQMVNLASVPTTWKSLS